MKNVGPTCPREIFQLSNRKKKKKIKQLEPPKREKVYKVVYFLIVGISTVIW